MSLNLPNRTEASYEPQKLSDRHFKILRLVSLGLGVRKIAQALGVSQPLVIYTKNSELGKVWLEKMRDGMDADTLAAAHTIQAATLDVDKEMEGLKALAVAQLAEIMLDPFASTTSKHSSAKTVLEYGKKGGITVNNNTVNVLDSEMLKEARDRAFRNAPEGMIVVENEDQEILD